jgi:hypothetical protein
MASSCCTTTLIHPHVAHRVHEHLNVTSLEVIKHLAYSLDKSPCGFHIFGPLKKALKFTPDDDG